MSALLDAAVKYGADMHWLVFPQAWPRDGKCSCGKPHCDHPAKHPHYGLAPNGHKDATNYRDAIGRFWQRDPDANIGLACGKLSLVVALDVDPRHGGDESLARLEREHGPLPLTPCSRTGGGGRHLFFRCPKGAVTGGDLAPGVELKANTAVTLPPSRHISGGAYEWMEGRSPFEIPLAELPAWVLERKTERRAATSTPGAPILDGTRNSTLTSLAGGMRAKGWSGDAIRAALHEENTLRCDPPLPDSEVDAIAKSIGSKTPRTETVSKGALTVTACSGITEKKIDWLWKGYVPRGVLTFLEGPPKAGKSTVYV
ncbi:MAG TPA: bifunctional DNA primase/polymerase, partial [Candidatus Eisenbacteria bacterium]|nr:bifunctional DNA primase/polymerase [Candidatus Eisenbacteria bacterium]